MHRTLIIAKLRTDDLSEIADVFADSDATELPRMLGASRRTLFRFHDLYIHLVEADQDITPGLYEARDHPLFHGVSTRLAPMVLPYDPEWSEPKDAMASPFYVWTAERGREL